MIKIFNYFLQSILIYLFYLIGLTLGLKNSRIIFANFFFLIGPIFKSKKIVQNNLRIFSSKISNLDERKIIENMWKNYGMTFIEYIFLKQFRERNSHMTIKGEENLLEIKKKNKPVIFVSGHFANYELMSMELSKAKVKLATIYRPLNNIFLNPFMEYLRKTFVCKNQIKKGLNGVKEALNFMKKGYSVALMVDQRVGEGPRVKFFNSTAHTTTLPAQLLTRFDCDIVPIYISRTINDKFVLEILEPIQISENIKGNKEIITEKINEIIEKLILRDPSQWILTHNRWK